jgi:DNA-binding CsgD family transcriptional regulator
MFERADLLFDVRAFDRLALADPAAERLLAEALDGLKSGARPTVRSIPVRPAAGRPAAVVHVVPLRRNARDIFSKGDILIAATLVNATASAPASTMLTALFDLTPAEAKLAAGIAKGLSINAAAVESGITAKTARSYLERVFAKTGTHRQGELVALLKNVPTLGSD